MQDKYHDYHFQEHGNHAHDLPAHRHVQENAEDMEGFSNKGMITASISFVMIFWKSEKDSRNVSPLI